MRAAQGIKLAKLFPIVHNKNVPGICAIFTHFNSRERTLTCLQRLADQQRCPEHIVIINNGSAGDPVLPEVAALAAKLLPPDTLHLLQMETNLGNAGGCARGLNYAFGSLGADFVWVLDDDSWPRPDTLKKLLAVSVDEHTVRMSLVIDPAKGGGLSWPLTMVGQGEAPWKNAVTCGDLPGCKVIPSRGGWLGALYPRAAWELAGVPTEELFIRGEDEEYPWKVRNAGFRFVTVRDSELEHPSASVPLIHYSYGHHSFFYEPGLPISRLYYKARNWAWLQRLKSPNTCLRRLVACGFYIILSLQAMLETDELTLSRVYTLLRALHNGFYGKLRPY